MSYEIYKPRRRGGESMALLVMLHGCGQTPQDFASGTRMNRLADEHGFLVVYPAQSPAANPLSCWNWFDTANQVRDRGEPGLIAGITRRVAADYGIDERRIFIAGLSAGGAMAVILGHTYPELFAAVGVHSGLPYGVAHDAVSGLDAMRGDLRLPSGPPPAAGPSGPWGASDRSDPSVPRRMSCPGLDAPRAIPTIVFHGDCDTTVAPSNGAAIVAAAVMLAERSTGPLIKTVEERQSAGGRELTTVRYRRAEGPPQVEYWVVHGAGHAWSGGSALGSFTDATGPDASAEMVRFFLAQRFEPPRLASA
jgi:poly(hydroxyalkanoate) depolymerase family esterase